MSVVENHPNKQEAEETIEIRLSDILHFLKDSRRYIIISGLIGLVAGMLYAFSKSDVYTSQITVMPEIQGKGTGSLSGLGSLAGLAGINIDNLGDQDAIRPDLYPNIIQSVPFALHMLKQPVYSVQLGKQLPLGAYMGQINKGRFSSLMKLNRKTIDTTFNKVSFNSPFIEITKEQDNLIKNIQTTITASYDKKTGILSISAIEPEALVAASVAKNSLDYLTNYITTYRTEKSRRQVNFLEKQVDNAKNRYQSAEYILSSYRDRNRSIYLNTAKIEEQRLQADYLLAQTLYNELSKQLEQAKIKVQEETPIFKTLEPPAVPLRKSGPKRTAIVLGFFVLSIVIALAIRALKMFLQPHSLKQA